MNAPRTMLEFRQYYVGLLLERRKVLTAHFNERIEAMIGHDNWDENDNFLLDLRHHIQDLRFELERIDGAIRGVLRSAGIADMKFVVDQYTADSQ